MLMTVSEVADYLKLSDKTVLRLVKNGEIPCAKIANQWRFSTAVLESWIAAQMNIHHPGPSALSRGTEGEHMTLKNLMQKERCLILSSTTKTESLLEMCDAVSGDIKDMEGLKKEIFYREQIMSTGIGQGIGIPHVRFAGITEPRIVVGIHPEGIADYDSLDGVPVKIVVMILVGAEQHKEYLRILSLIVGKLKDEAVCSALQAADGPGMIRDLFAGEA